MSPLPVPAEAFFLFCYGRFFGIVLLLSGNTAFSRKFRTLPAGPGDEK